MSADRLNPIFSRNISDYRVDCKCKAELRWVRLVCRNGVIQIQRQCPVCGDATGAIPVALAPTGWPEFPLRDEALRVRTRERRSQEAAAARDVRNAAWWARYHAYMKSDAWKIRRKAILRRCGGTCESCEKAPATEVHHLCYDNIGNEKPDDLAAVCHPCHEKITASQRKWNGREIP